MQWPVDVFVHEWWTGAGACALTGVGFGFVLGLGCGFDVALVLVEVCARVFAAVVFLAVGFVAVCDGLDDVEDGAARSGAAADPLALVSDALPLPFPPEAAV